MNTEQNEFIKFSNAEKLMPQEEVLEVNRDKSSLTIGIPRETSYQENRVPLVPQAVGLLVANGHKVLVESNAGKSAHFSDEEFSEVGAQIIKSNEEVFKANIVIKVAPPSIEEVDLLKIATNNNFIFTYNRAVKGIF